jgi:hypothetical protein
MLVREVLINPVILSYVNKELTIAANHNLSLLKGAFNKMLARHSVTGVKKYSTYQLRGYQWL